MALGGFAFDMFIHVVLGFGLNEVYIMGAHWLFVMPIAMAYIFKAVDNKKLIFMRGLIGFLTVYLLAYNLSLLVPYLL